MRSWKHSGFSVDQSVRLEAGDRDGIQRLIPYLLRRPFFQARMIEVTDAGRVLYKTGDNRLGRFPEAASDDLLPGPKRNFQIFDPLDFLAEVTQHIPEMGVRPSDPVLRVLFKREIRTSSPHGASNQVG
jgi:Putative transposase